MRAHGSPGVAVGAVRRTWPVRRHRADHRRHRRSGRAWSPGTWSPSTASAGCCWSAGAAAVPSWSSELAALGAEARVGAPATSPTALRRRPSAGRRRADRRGARRRRARRRRPSDSLTAERLAGGAAAQGRRGVAPARADRATWTCRRSCCSPRPPACSAAPGRPTTRRPTPSSTRWPRTAGPAGLPAIVAGVGAVGAERRHDRQPDRRATSARMARAGIAAAVGDEQALALFDAGRRHRASPALVPVRLDLPAVRAARRRARRCCAGSSRPRAAARSPAVHGWPAGSPGSAEADRRAVAARPGPRRRWRPCWGTPAPAGVDSDAAFQELGLRLADRGRAAQPAERGDRAAAAGDAGVRLPDPGRAGGVPAGGAVRRATPASAEPAAVAA